MEIVIVGDVIKSRKKFNPIEWEHFHSSINRINKEHKDQLKIPITIYSGDSFGCICKNIKAAVQIVLDIQNLQKPYDSRMVLIQDEITFGLDKGSFLNLEGPALWKSQNNLQKLKTEGELFSSNLRNKEQNLSVETILNLILTIRKEWSSIEWTIAMTYEHNLMQKETARIVGVSQQYVSKVLKKSNIKTVHKAKKNLIQLVS